MHVVLGAVRGDVDGATLALAHGDAEEAEWSLEISANGAVSQLSMSGTVATPTLPGPSVLDIHHVDDPETFELDGRTGSLTSSDTPPSLQLVAAGDGRVRIAGRTILWWHAFDDDQPSRVDLPLELVIEAAITQPD